MTDRWKENSNPWVMGERTSLFASTRASHRYRSGTPHLGLKMQDNQERQPRLWSRISSDIVDHSQTNAGRRLRGSHMTDSSRLGQTPSNAGGSYNPVKATTTRQVKCDSTPDDVEDITVLPVTVSQLQAINDANNDDKGHVTTVSDTLTVQLIEEPKRSSGADKEVIIDSASRETTADGDSPTERLSSLKDLDVPAEKTPVDTSRAIHEPAGIAADFIAKLGCNPFAIFRLKHARSAVEVSEAELSYVKAVMLSKRHSPEELHSFFKSSISVTNVQMMYIILEFLQDVIISDVSYRELCVRMMETALVYHPDELVHCFSCKYISTLFDPEVDDDVGGRFIRLFLSYKATFGAPGIQVPGIPLCVDSSGNFCYNVEQCDSSDLSFVSQQSDVSYENFELDNENYKNGGYAPTTGHIALEKNIFISCGKVESMALLKICADRAGVISAFDIPASRLRDWLCTIWYELPATRPCLPLMRLCINWIDCRDDPTFLKDAAFALLRKELTILGVFEGGRLLMLELLSFMIKRNGDANVELSKIIDMLAEGEDNILYAVLDSIISRNLMDDSMLDLWCLLCILPWPVVSPDSAICRLMSCTFLIYYQLAYDALRDDATPRHFSSNPMGLLENALRICVCRCSSPVLSKSALLQTILLVELSPLPAVRMTNAPLILSSLCPFLWKCHFIWSNCGRDIDADSLLALCHLYDVLRTCVFCEALHNGHDEMGSRKVPLFPRIQFDSDDGKSADIDSFIGAHNPLDLTVYEAEVGPTYEHVVPEIPEKPTVHALLDRPRGLRNLGNTCYYNSMLQALFHTRSFVHGLFELSEVNEYASVYQRMFRKLMKRGRKAYDPRPGYKLLPSSWTRQAEQQDVTETFSHVLEAIDATLALRRRIFAGLVLRRVKCLGCGKLSDNREIAMDFTFPVTGLRSIQAMFDDFCKIETLCGGNRYFCSHCDAYRRAEMWNVIASPPAHLMVVLSRQLWRLDSDPHGSIPGASKLLDHVRVDDRLRICDFDYTLYGSIFHSGVGSSSGHYYFVGRDSEAPSRWHICDDSQVREASETTVNDISQDKYNSDVPYVLFYRCAQAPATPL
ncbi:ubiquitin carboxyl-terminal hydrolase [Babesia ovis]|uniref:Ubiquitin carboxyl-terminal hydrolase n=1 Tax=Babesia ovis TaxID=5869 RepID=A0A9W5T8J2_BABOV|nr:ubiquitin carboxyl-terminal hydrolase [Babesia ovis]